MLSKVIAGCRSGAQWNSGVPVLCLQWQASTEQKGAKTEGAMTFIQPGHMLRPAYSL
jgi:hypothetical protein